MGLEPPLLLGELLLDSADERALVSWMQQVPPGLQQAAGIWYIRGMLARRRGQTPQALRAFWEAVHL